MFEIKNMNHAPRKRSALVNSKGELGFSFDYWVLSKVVSSRKSYYKKYLYHLGGNFLPKLPLEFHK